MIDMDDLISVIVPVYNAEKYLPECIESILSQTYRNIELILVNDGSTDGSLAIAKGASALDERVVVVESENKGVSSARNLGLDIAKGRFYTFVDADDFLLRNAIEILCCTIRTYNADIAIARSSSSLIFGTKAEQKEIKNCWIGDEALRANLYGDSFTYGACANLYRADLTHEIRFPKDMRVHEDSFYIFQCLLLHPKVVTQETEVYYYRNNNESSSHAPYSKKYLDIITLAKKKVSQIKKNKPELLGEAQNIIIRADLALLVITCRGKLSEVKELVYRLCKEIRSLERYYIPCSRFEERLMVVVKLHLFWLFRIYYRLRW